MCRFDQLIFRPGCMLLHYWAPQNSEDEYLFIKQYLQDQLEKLDGTFDGKQNFSRHNRSLDQGLPRGLQKRRAINNIITFA